MRLLLSVLVALALVCFARTRPMAAQIVQDSVGLQPVTGTSSHIVHWTFDDGVGQQTIYLKNTATDRIVTITSWRVFACENIKRRSCREHKESLTLPPGQTVRLATVQRDNEELSYSFQYDFNTADPDQETRQ